MCQASRGLGGKPSLRQYVALVLSHDFEHDVERDIETLLNEVRRLRQR